MLVIAHLMLGCRISDTGCSLLDVNPDCRVLRSLILNYPLLDAGPKLGIYGQLQRWLLGRLMCGCWMLDAKLWILFAAYWALNVGYGTLNVVKLVPHSTCWPPRLLDMGS